MNPILQTISNVLNTVAPIVNIIGTIAYCAMIVRGVLEILYPMAILTVIGIIYGIIALKNNIAPRMFWFKKANAIYSTSFSMILAYGIMFALWAPLLRVFFVFI